MSTPWIAAFCLLSLTLVVLALFVRGVAVRAVAALERAEALLPEGMNLTAGGVEPGTKLFGEGRSSSDAPIASRLAGRRSIVLFLEPSCQPCQILVADMASHPVDLDEVALVPVVEATQEGRELAARIPIPAIYQAHGEISRMFGTRSSPHAFAVNEDGVVVGVSVPNTVPQLVQLAAYAWRGGEPRAEATTTTRHSVVTT
jgi:hypothetical protein